MLCASCSKANASISLSHPVLRAEFLIRILGKKKKKNTNNDDIVRHTRDLYTSIYLK